MRNPIKHLSRTSLFEDSRIIVFNVTNSNYFAVATIILFLNRSSNQPYNAEGPLPSIGKYLYPETKIWLLPCMPVKL